ncbi:hypothetical protein U9M48_005733, partial [Paspalum notatum var. saurae]
HPRHPAPPPFFSQAPTQVEALPSTPVLCSIHHLPAGVGAATACALLQRQPPAEGEYSVVLFRFAGNILQKRSLVKGGGCGLYWQSHPGSGELESRT